MTSFEKVGHLPPMTRVRQYIMNFIFNGFLGMFIAAVFVYFVVPTSFFFEYDSVYPQIEPVDISADGIRMESNIIGNYTNGDFEWNDVLRCNYNLDPEGYFEYVGQSDTSIKTSKKLDSPHLSPWTYTGRMPQEPALCQMHSTITRNVLGFIPKEQFVQSRNFLIE